MKGLVTMVLLVCAAVVLIVYGLRQPAPAPVENDATPNVVVEETEE